MISLLNNNIEKRRKTKRKLYLENVERLQLLLIILQITLSLLRFVIIFRHILLVQTIDDLHKFV